MTILYPIECPTTLRPSSVKWSTTTAISISQSPTTFQTTKYEYDGEAWVIEVSYPPLKREEAAPFFAFLAALRGQNGTFLFGDTLLAASLGTPGGTPQVNGASQTGSKVLVTDGWTPSTKVLKAGDFFAIDFKIYMVLADVTSNGSGQANIDVFPRVRTHADNSPIDYDDARGTFRLLNDSQAIVTAGPSKLFDISFQAAEAL